MLPAPELDVGGAVARTGARDQLGQPAVPVGPHHQVDLGHALEQPGAEALRHAPHHAEYATGPLVPLQLAQPPQHALLGVVAHGAGVDEDHVRAPRVVGAHVSFPPQHPEHQLGVGDVHLAAVCLDVEARHR